MKVLFDNPTVASLVRYIADYDEPKDDPELAEIYQLCRRWVNMKHDAEYAARNVL